MIRKSTLIFLVYIMTIVYCQINNFDSVRGIFTKDLVTNIGDGEKITVFNVTEVFRRHFLHLPYNSSLEECINNSSASSPFNETCLLEKCLTPKDVYTLSGLSQNTSHKEVSSMALILLHLMENTSCTEEIPHHDEHFHHARPSAAEAWGFGILCTTVISFASLGGVIALPFVHGVNYKRILIFMVGLAVGTLAGSSLLFLIPEALELTEQDLDEHSYIWKCCVMISGVYAFFIIERVLKMITESRERSKQDKQLHHQIQPGTFASFHEAPPESEMRDVNRLPYVDPCGGDNVSDLSKDDATVKKHSNGDLQHNGTNGNSHTGHTHASKHVAPVAWMIIFGDGVHNFIDGVSIGAAFTESILAGVSVSVAIMCEELPHELGDFAVLLNAGMKIKRAVMYNFLSACMCYLGLIVGIFLGENTAAHTWVFAFAGGMFLYISLVDMMPEMNSAGESEENKKLIGGGTIFLLQNVGILTGFAIMLIMAIYGGNLERAIKGY